VGVVRRLTGGRAILHHPGEVTYSVAALEDDPHLAGGVMASYRSINQALVAGLGLLGIRAAMRERPPIWPDTGVGFGCFEDAYRHEVYWAGRKIVASAQRRQSGALLQQGSIPGRETGEDLASFLKLDPAKRTTLKRELSQRTSTIARALDGLPPFSEIAGALAQGFRNAWGTELIEAILTPEEQALAAELEGARYSSLDETPSSAQHRIAG
jgi:lipoate-protein ligase A